MSRTLRLYTASFRRDVADASSHVPSPYEARGAAFRVGKQAPMGAQHMDGR
jgi:hypothetical protein